MARKKLEELNLLDNFLFGSMVAHPELGDSLQSGKDYENLKNVMVVFISPYDPFGKNHMIYTIRNMCEEIPSLTYDDGSRTIFLYTKGTEGNPPKEVCQLLHYMEHTTTENAVNDSLKSIDQMVNAVKHDREVSLNYMKMIEWEKMLIRQGRKEEQANTERERLRAFFAEERADRAEERANHAEQEIQILKEQLEAERKKIH